MLREILIARRRIKPYVLDTPIIRSIALSKRFESEIFLKLENFQITGSFKVRGVFNKLLKLREKGFRGRIVTVSTGNHGLAVAYASSVLGYESLIILPKNVVGYKLERIKLFGVNIDFHGSNYDEAESYARELASKGYEFISPYNDLDVIAGQGTIGYEIARDVPNIDIVIVPVGGGGLISGIASYLKETIKDVKVIGVQSEASAPMFYSLKADRIVKVDLKPSIADGLHGNIEDDSITFDFVKKYVDEIVLVAEDSIKEAMKMLYRYEGQIVEGSGAVPLSAILEDKINIKGKKTLLVLSGGNIDPLHLRFLMED